MPSNDYFNALIDYTRDTRYSVSTRLTWEKLSFDISLDTLTNNFLNTSAHTSNKHRLSYSFELNTQVTLVSLDSAMTWSLDSCWLSDQPCASNLTEDLIALGNYQEEYYYDDMTVEGDDYEDYDTKSSEFEHANPSSASLRRARNIIESTTKLTYSSSTHFKFNAPLNHYETHLNITLSGYNMKNLQNRKYLFCYLKPCSVCECMGDQLETKVRNLRYK